MIISRKHRYIFLHCRKTAGSSMSVSLARDLGPDDLLLSGIKETMAAGIAVPDRVNRESLEEAKALKKGRFRRQMQLSGMLGADKKMKATTKLIRARYRPALGHHCQHAPAKLIRDAFPEDWANCRKFCVVRDPWDKVVSDYFWRTRDTQDKPSFDTFVHAMNDNDDLGGIVPVGVKDNWPLYTIDDEIIADEVIRFENLTTELAEAMERLDIPWDGWLPRAKGNHRPKGPKSSAADLYTPALRRIVRDMFDHEFNAFGYDA